MGGISSKSQNGAVGIDLGTTYSSVAFDNGADTTAIALGKTGSYLYPSVVAYEYAEGEEKPKRVVTGHEAVDLSNRILEVRN